MQTELDVYPNPSSGKIFLKPTGSGNLNISDISGKIIFSSEIQGHEVQEIDLESWTKGIYFISFSSGNQEMTEKLVVQ